MIASCALGVVPAAAQPARVADGGLEPIIVTVQKRTQDSLDVPFSLTVRTSEDLRRLGAPTLRELAPTTPGLHVEAQDSSTPSIVIRGISTDTTDVTLEPRVSVFQDGVYISRSQAALSELFDIDRIEVAKGPQSTLFGRSALAGAINIIQNKADPGRFAGSTRVEVGDYGARTVDGMVNVPVGQTLAIRIAARRRQTDGYVDNLASDVPLDGQRVDAARIAIHWEPTAWLVSDLIANLQNDRGTGISLKSATFFPADPVTGARLGDLAADHPVYLTTAPTYPLGGLGSRRRLGGATFNLSAHLAPVLNLTSTTAYSQFSSRFVGDYDGTSLPFVTSGEDDRGRQISEDVRLAWTPPGRLSGFVGANASLEHDRQRSPIMIDERLGLDLLTGYLDRTNPVLSPLAAYTSPQLLAGLVSGIARAYGASLSPTLAQGIASNLQATHIESYDRLSRVREMDVYGQAVLRLTERIELEGGLRYAADRRTSGLAGTTGDRSILAGLLGALSQAEPVRTGLLSALAVPGAAFIPTSAAYPVPRFALLAQPTATPGGDAAGLADDGLAWRLTARYQLSPTTNAYIGYARGRRPEVLSADPPRTPGGPSTFTPLAAETLDSYEAGLKFRTPNRRLEVDLAAFAYDYRHFQTEILVGSVPVPTDAGRASAYGAEAQARWAPAQWAELFATYGYTHARFGSGLYEGNAFRQAPDHTVAVGATLTAEVFGRPLDVSPTLTWRSRIWFDNSNGKSSLFVGYLVTPLTYQPSQAAVGLANLHLSYGPRGAGWRVEAMVSNLLDKRYLRDTGAGSLQFGLPTYVAAPPRMVSAALSLAL